MAPRLPLQFTRFFGREAEIKTIGELPRPETSFIRLLTLTGLGGSGKTRLAIEAATRLAPLFNNRVFFAPLADVADAGRIADAVLDALGRDRLPGVTAMDQVVEVFASAPASLLVLDNFEHLAEADGAPLIADLLRRAPHLYCLVTSRQRLLLEAERELPVLPLPTPTIPEGALPERLMDFAAIALFVDRAQRARPDFQITSRNAAAVAELCARLEGIPLAIELAAAWANTLSLSALLARLDETGRFSLLTSRRRDITARHRTLRAAIETSVRALPPDLQAFFARLSVFRGGWTAEAASDVCGASLARAEDALAHLREHSLIVPAATAGSPRSDLDAVPLRFTLLETLREFGAEHLEETLGAGEAAVLRKRHARYFLALAEKAEPHFFGPDPAPYLDRLEAEQVNLHAALAWAKDEDNQLGLRLAGALDRFWVLRGSRGDARRWLETFLARAGGVGKDEPGGAATRAKALLAATHFSFTEAEGARLQALASESLRLYRRSGDRQGTARALRRLAHLLAHEHRLAEARPLAEESQALCDETGDEAGVADGLCLLAHIAYFADEEQCVPLMEQAVAQWRWLGYADRVAETLNHLGCWALWSGDVERGEGLLNEALALCRRLDDHTGTAHALWALGNAALTQGDLVRAAVRLEECIAIERARGASGINPRNDLARVRLAQQDEERAKALLLENLSLAPDDVRNVRYVFRHLARIAATNRPGKAGRPALAARLWGAAWAQHEVLVRRLIERGAVPSSHSTDLPDEPFVAEVRAALGAPAFRAAVEAGKSLPLEQAIALAHDA